MTVLNRSAKRLNKSLSYLLSRVKPRRTPQLRDEILSHLCAKLRCPCNLGEMLEVHRRDHSLKRRTDCDKL